MHITLELSKKLSEVLQNIDYKKLELVTQAVDWEIFTDQGLVPYDEHWLRETAHETLYRCAEEFVAKNLQSYSLYVSGWYCICERELDAVYIGDEPDEEIITVNIRFVVEDYES
jgi:hypothetical protein